MDRTKLQALASELVKDMKTEADLIALSRELLKLTVETALSAELTATWIPPCRKTPCFFTRVLPLTQTTTVWP